MAGLFEIRDAINTQINVNSWMPPLPQSYLHIFPSDDVYVIEQHMHIVLSLQQVCIPCTYGRLQLKRGLLWYRHYPKLHEMVKYRSSRAENLTNLHEISMRVSFSIQKHVEKMMTWSKKTQTCRFS